jgi:lysine-specific demethylase 8
MPRAGVALASSVAAKAPRRDAASPSALASAFLGYTVEIALASSTAVAKDRPSRVVMHESLSIPRLPAPSLEVFRRDYERPRRPVVITNALDGRRTLEGWSLERLRSQHAAMNVTVRSSRRGNRQLFDGDPLTTFAFETMRLGDALAEIACPAERTLYVHNSDLGRAPELAAEVGKLRYAPRWLCSPPLLWVSGPGTVQPLHWDYNHVALAQIRGEKRFVLFRPEDSTKLAPFIHRSIWRTSGLDPNAIDRARFPSVDLASAWSCTIGPGDILFIPYRWWHYMESDTVSISVSWWWEPSLWAHLRASAREAAARRVRRILRAFKAQPTGVTPKS